MIKDLIETIKAKLYDFYYNPFLISVFISWLIINREYLLIYFSDSKIETKLKLLKNYDFSWIISLSSETRYIPMFFCLILPILVGLVYVYLYPLIAINFYEYTLKRNKKLREAKQKIENETLLSTEESRMIRLEIIKIGEESKSKDDKISLLLEQLKKEKNDTDLLEKKLNQIKKQKMNKMEEQELNSKIKKEYPNSSENNIVDEEIVNALNEIKSINVDRNKDILKYLFDTNPKYVRFNIIVNSLYNETGIAKVKIEAYMKMLIGNGVLYKEVDSFNNIYITLTDKGKSILLALDEDGFI